MLGRVLYGYELNVRLISLQLLLSTIDNAIYATELVLRYLNILFHKVLPLLRSTMGLVDLKMTEDYSDNETP